MLVFGEPKPNPIRTEVFRVPNVSEIDLYTYILVIFLDLMYIKTSRIYMIFLS